MISQTNQVRIQNCSDFSAVIQLISDPGSETITGANVNLGLSLLNDGPTREKTISVQKRVLLKGGIAEMTMDAQKGCLSVCLFDQQTKILSMKDCLVERAHTYTIYNEKLACQPGIEQRTPKQGEENDLNFPDIERIPSIPLFKENTSTSPGWEDLKSTIDSLTTSRDPKKAKVKNIILFGTAGKGKSSIINMLAGRELTRISNSAVGCTFNSQSYTIIPVDKGHNTFNIWDTAGLNESSQGTVDPNKSLFQLLILLKSLKQTGGISLLIYVMSADRIQESDEKNVTIFRQTLCEYQVPLIIAVTKIESKQNWVEQNQSNIQSSLGLTKNDTLMGLCCIKELPICGQKIDLSRAYDQSRKQLWEAILEHYLEVPWCSSMTIGDWAFTIFKKIFNHVIQFLGLSEHLVPLSGLLCEILRQTGYDPKIAILEANKIERALENNVPPPFQTSLIFTSIST